MQRLNKIVGDNGAVFKSGRIRKIRAVVYDGDDKTQADGEFRERNPDMPGSANDQVCLTADKSEKNGCSLSNLHDLFFLVI